MRRPPATGEIAPPNDTYIMKCLRETAALATQLGEAMPASSMASKSQERVAGKRIPNSCGKRKASGALSTSTKTKVAAQSMSKKAKVREYWL